MWKRIHSNRDPRDTLYSEIRKEFGTYFTIAGNAASAWRVPTRNLFWVHGLPDGPIIIRLPFTVSSQKLKFKPP
jgi:hypothetical protein